MSLLILRYFLDLGMPRIPGSAIVIADSDRRRRTLRLIEGISCVR